MADLAEHQFELSGLLFGEGTDYWVRNADFGTPETRLADTPIPRGDGTRMGRDYMNGRTIAFDMGIVAETPRLFELHSEIASVWDGLAVRSEPGLVSELRFNLSGQTRSVFGRPRRFAADIKDYVIGWLPITADFQCVDHLTYGQERSISVGLATPVSAGVTWPATWPITWGVAPSEGVGDFFVSGDMPSWAPFTVFGPILNPTVTFIGHFAVTLDINLAYDEWVDVNPEPWKRSVLKNGTVNVAGAITPSSPRLSALRIPPGEHRVGISGTDSTRTARVEARIRDTFAGM